MKMIVATLLCCAIFAVSTPAISQAPPPSNAVCGIAQAKFGLLPEGVCAPVDGEIAVRNTATKCAGGTYGAPRNGVRDHEGLDLVAAVGSPVYAARAGIVVDKRNFTYSSGIHISVEHGDGSVSRYFHLSAHDPTIEVQLPVTTGQQIGLSGITGNAAQTGCPHLHLEIRKAAYPPQGPGGYTYGTTQDPLLWLLEPRAPMVATARQSQ
jgi:murein DD-endopeptidase MepM/ murein hydrolase activator NlpD